MISVKKVSFHEYRYQILPISQEIQMDLGGEIRGVEDLKNKKNTFFKDVVDKFTSFEYSRAPIRHKKLWLEDDIFIIKLGVERDLKRRTRDFEIEDVENWSTAVIAFNNNPKVQKCLVQERGGFQDTGTVIRILEESLNKVLLKYQLAVHFEPIYAKRYFWDLVQKHEGKITQIEFELISPNMSNISANLKLDLNALQKSTNTQRTNLKLNSDEHSCLTPTQSDTMVDSLVDYSSQGGGDITLRVRGFKKKIHTASGINEISLDELKLEHASPSELADIFRNLTE